LTAEKDFLESPPCTPNISHKWYAILPFFQSDHRLYDSIFPTKIRSHCSSRRRLRPTMEQDHMLREQPPSYSQSHDPQSLSFPSAPTADPPPIHHERTLPPLPPAPAEPRLRAEEHQFVWPSSNPLTAYYQPGPSQLSPKTTSSSHDIESPRTMDLDTPDSRRRGGSVLSIDDPDVRIAAEALGDLRAGTF
jgi:hypothetical protein